MRILFVFGTRPEAIKMAPVIRELSARPSAFDVRVCVTAQHRHMLDQVLAFFDITPDYDLNLMEPNQTLFGITARSLEGLHGVLEDARPDTVFVQGDTTTTFTGALAAYYLHIPVCHLEAGLRSGHKFSPFPEELNRVLTSRLADMHFAPTARAQANLEAEGVTENVWVVGNTVIDALLSGLEIIASHGEDAYHQHFAAVDFSRRVVLVTGHRRESFGEPFENMAHGLRDAANAFPDVEFVYPVHLNPNVQRHVRDILFGIQNIHLMAPVDYPQMIWLMNKSHIVVTDSGGVQEEAPALGKPVLVTRDVTERLEGVNAGTAQLVGTDRARIREEVCRLLTDTDAYNRMAQAVNPYGDGTASAQIAEILDQQSGAIIRAGIP